MAEKLPPSERITASFRELALVSPEVDSAAEDLANSISTLESYLRRIGIKVSAWHRIAGEDADQEGYYWSRDIGWSSVRDTWRIAIRKTNGNEHYDEHNEEIWGFADAPRWMAVEAVSKLPDLFETLIQRTKEMTKKLKARAKETNELAAAIAAVFPEADQQIAALKKGKK
jgi:hypothetical protein